MKSVLKSNVYKISLVLALLVQFFSGNTALAQNECDYYQKAKGKIVRYGEDLEEPAGYDLGDQHYYGTANLCKVDFVHEDGICVLRNVTVVAKFDSSSPHEVDAGRLVREYRICDKLQHAMEREQPVEIKIIPRNLNKVIDVTGVTTPVTVLELEKLFLHRLPARAPAPVHVTLQSKKSKKKK